METTLEQELHTEADLVWRDMGESFLRLLVPKDGSVARLVIDPRPRIKEIKPEAVNKERFVALAIVRDLIRRGAIGKLTEHGENHKIGWREVGLDGNANDVYVLVQ